LGGSENFRSMALSFYKGIDIVIFFYCINSKYSFEELKEYWVKSVVDKLGKDTLFWLVGTKVDLFIKEEVTKEEGIEYAKKIGAKFIETSSKDKVCREEIKLFIN